MKSDARKTTTPKNISRKKEANASKVPAKTAAVKRPTAKTEAPKVKTMETTPSPATKEKKRIGVTKRPAVQVTEITWEMISERAHQIWVEEGYPEGRAEEHWLRAEAELSRENS